MATLGFGATLSGTTLGAIGEILDLQRSGISVDAVDTSSGSSTNKVRTFVGGMIDPGEITFNCIYDKTDYASIESNAGTTDSFTITYPDSSTDVSSGFISGVSAGASYEDKMTVDVTIKCSGEWTFTAGT